MIRSISANKGGFRAVTLNAGVNVILADRSNTAGDRDTTNALGKSTLIDIIDFCLGSNTSAGKGLRVEALQDWVFTLELDVAGHAVRVSRATSVSSVVYIEGATIGWLYQPTINDVGIKELDVKSWRAVLGRTMFNLSEKVDEKGHKPSARSLLSYFVRNQSTAYNSPFKYFDSQQTWDVQIHNAFLLGLNWEKAAAWQKLKDQKSALDALKQAIKTGAVQGELSSVGELEAERLSLLEQLERERAALTSFKVLPQYREIEMQANELTASIHRMVNANIVDKRRVERYHEVVALEAAPVDSRLEQLYKEAGVVLPELIVKSLDDARIFTEKIVANRREFISSELVALEAAIEKRTSSIAELTARRAEYLCTLAGQGALEEYTRLQTLHASTKSKVDTLTSRIAQLRQMATRLDEIKVDTVELKRATTVDYEERRPLWTRALSLFSSFSDRLYKTPGKLVIDIGDAGYKFDVEIDGGPSEGISKMKIFCYDLMLISYARQRGLGIDFLIHDSTIFDGVDPRQRAHAIELAEEMARTYGFQYVCTLNTDMVPVSDFSAEFDFQRFVRLRLTDTDASGSLLGFRF